LLLFHHVYHVSNWPIVTQDGNKAVAQAVIFGLGSMFNHARNPNIGWTRDLDLQVVTYRALRLINKGEELCKFRIRTRISVDRKGITYGDRLTFKDSDAIEEEDDPDVLNSISFDCYNE
jgi:hypothetical protein